MKHLKKLTALILASAMLLSLASCGSSKPAETTAAPEQTTAAPEETTAEETTQEVIEPLEVKGEKSSHLDSGTEPIKIAFIIYKWSDDQGIYLQHVADTIAENFNVEFEYIAAVNTAEETIKAVESLCSKGVDGIIAANTKGFQSWAQICEDKGVYYSIMLGCLEDADDQEFAKNCKYFLGSIGNFDYSFLGEAYAKYTEEQGFENILVAAPAKGAQTQADQMVEAFEAYLDSKNIPYDEFRSAFGELFAGISSQIAAKDYDIIYCPLSMMNFAVSNIYANQLVGTTAAMGHGNSEDLEDALDAGVVKMFSDNFTSDIGVNFAIMANAIEGNLSEYGFPEGEYVNITAPCFIIENEDDYAVYKANVRNYDDNPIVCDMDTIKSLIMSYNGEASLEKTKEYVENMSLDVFK